MRIVKVDIPKEKIDNGLEAVQMHKLDQIVILAGKNGSGKTRLLNLVKNKIIEKPGKNQIYSANAALEANKKHIEQHEESIKNYERILENTSKENTVQQSKFNHQIEENKRSMDMWLQQNEKQNEILNWKYIETDTLPYQYTIVDFVPKQLGLQNIDAMARHAIKTSAKNIDAVGVGHLHSGTYPRLQIIQNRWREARHQDTILSQEEIASAIDEYDRLNELLRVFLNTELGRNIDGEATIFGFPVGREHLSDGQKILLQFCLAIHCQQKSLDELILFLDEPENHLHPSVIMEIIERLRSKTTKGQIWISTHSVPLISYFDTASIWYIDNNKVSYAGNIPEIVLKGLLGDESRISKLQDFIALPGILALNNHAFESLFQPSAVTTDKNDPQPLQIHAEIKKHLKEDKKIKVLDYGAGKGRLLANIIENNSEPLDTFRTWFDYVAFDKYDTDKDECVAVLQKLYPDWENRYFNSFTDLFSKHNKEEFDIVVMCNVLHEIDPADWLKLFSKGGEIPELLNEKGILLLVEDNEMPIGEKAYQKGFIVLNTPDIKDLFSIKSEDTDFGFSDARNDGRLKAHRIKKGYLTRIDSDSRIKALTSINTRASQEILEIRKKSITYKNGRVHGFWIQQLANTSLALKELTNK